MRSTRAAALAELRERFEHAGIDAASAAADAELLLLHALSLSRAAFWIAPGALLAPAESSRIEELAVRREARVPVQLLIGSVDFHDVTIAVEPGVFVPRPETESLVEAALERLRASGGAGRPGRLLDLGTGTGAVAVALLHALPAWTGVAIDRSPAALALARRNADANGVGARLELARADAFPPGPGGFAGGDAPFSAGGGSLPAPDAHAGPLGAPGIPLGPYDLLVSNPPYVRSGDIPGLMPEVRDHDPREALDGGADGLDAYRTIARLAPGFLREGGLLALEMGDDQADAILGLPEWGGIMGARLETPQVRRDLAGRQRVVVATWRGGVA